MRAHAHLRLIVSEPAVPKDSAAAERISVVQPMSNLQVWVRQQRRRDAYLWLASAVRLCAAGAAGAARRAGLLR